MSIEYVVFPEPSTVSIVRRFGPPRLSGTVVVVQKQPALQAISTHPVAIKSFE